MQTKIRSRDFTFSLQPTLSFLLFPHLKQTHELWKTILLSRCRTDVAPPLLNKKPTLPCCLRSSSSPTAQAECHHVCGLEHQSYQIYLTFDDLDSILRSRRVVLTNAWKSLCDAQIWRMNPPVNGEMKTKSEICSWLSRPPPQYLFFSVSLILRSLIYLYYAR